MRRALLTELMLWKDKKGRKPLILQGARQVGKTWLIKEFGRLAYEQVIYINFEHNDRLRNLFKRDFDLRRILATLAIESGLKPSPENTLILFDEIQVAERGVAALKYFFEEAPEWHIIAAGSLLGVSLQPGSTFPVGKVDFLKLYPLSFFEFAENLGEGNLIEHLKQGDWAVVESFHDRLTDLLRFYYFVGGMPEAVATYIEARDLSAVRQVQVNILTGYENDFAKYAPPTVTPRIRMVWQSLLSQLAKENRKYIYAQIKQGARAKDFELAINWLSDAGLITKVQLVQKPQLPLSAYADFDAFKLFTIDIGLLNAQGQLDPRALLEKNQILIEYKGALTEQFVFQQLIPDFKLYYWSAIGTSEIDFLLQTKNQIVPIEVKAEVNLKAKSIRVFIEKYQIVKGLRTSMAFHKLQERLTNYPLYSVSKEMIDDFVR